MFRKQTLRRMTPAQRKYAKTINEIEKLLNRMKKMTETLGEFERANIALFNRDKYYKGDV